MENKKVYNRLQIILCVIGFIVLIGPHMISSKQITTMQENIKSQELKIADLQNGISQNTAEKNKTRINVVKSATGLDRSRVERDDEMADALLSSIMTWSNGEQYDKNRENLMELIGADNPIFETFMPENVKYQDVNYIDTHKANSKYEGMESHVLNIDGDNYTYISLVKWSSSLGNIDGEAHCIFQYTVDKDGNVSNVNAYTISER